MNIFSDIIFNTFRRNKHQTKFPSESQYENNSKPKVEDKVNLNSTEDANYLAEVNRNLSEVKDEFDNIKAKHYDNDELIGSFFSCFSFRNKEEFIDQYKQYHIDNNDIVQVMLFGDISVDKGKFDEHIGKLNSLLLHGIVNIQNKINSKYGSKKLLKKWIQLYAWKFRVIPISENEKLKAYNLVEYNQSKLGEYIRGFSYPERIHLNNFFLNIFKSRTTNFYYSRPDSISKLSLEEVHSLLFKLIHSKFVSTPVSELSGRILKQMKFDEIKELSIYLLTRSGNENKNDLIDLIIETSDTESLIERIFNGYNRPVHLEFTIKDFYKDILEYVIELNNQYIDLAYVDHSIFSKYIDNQMDRQKEIFLIE